MYQNHGRKFEKKNLKKLSSKKCLFTNKFILFPCKNFSTHEMFTYFTSSKANHGISTYIRPVKLHILLIFSFCFPFNFYLVILLRMFAGPAMC